MINEIVSKDIYFPNAEPVSPVKEEVRRKMYYNSFIEMGDLSQLKNKNFKNDQSSLVLSVKEESNIMKDGLHVSKQGKQIVLTFLAFDPNFYEKTDIILDMEKIILYLKTNTRFSGDHIQRFDLNNIYNYLTRTHGELFDNNKRLFRIKMGAFGVDKFKQKRSMSEEFGLEISYILV